MMTHNLKKKKIEIELLLLQSVTFGEDKPHKQMLYMTKFEVTVTLCWFCNLEWTQLFGWVSLTLGPVLL